MESYRCHIAPLYSRFERDFPVDLRIYLREAMAVAIKNAHFVPKVRSGLWDGRIKFFREISASFLTGLLPWVTELLLEYDTPARVEPVYERMPLLKPRLPELKAKLRSEAHQEPIIKEALAVKRGIVQAAVNAGKSVIAMEIIRRLRLQTVYLVPTTELFNQFYADARKFLPGMPIGQIKGGRVFEPNLLTVAMYQSLVKRITNGDRDAIRWLNKVEVVFADECHKAGSDKWSKIFKEARGAQYRFGLSGTPQNMGQVRDLSLIGLTGPLFGKITRKELVARGLSVDTIVRFISYDKEGGELDDVFSRRDMHEIYRVGIEENERRARATWTMALVHLNKKQRVCILVETTDHGDYLAHVLRGAARRKGMPDPQVLYGPHSQAQRRAGMELFKSGKRPVLITTLLKEGVNIPEIDVIFNAGSKRSENAVIQHGGRVHRVRKGKVLAYIYDYIDPAHEMLLDWSLDRHAAFKGDDYKIEMVEA